MKYNTPREDLCVKIIVVSDRIAEGIDRDLSGEFAVEFLRNQGYCMGGKSIIRNSYREILRELRESGERVLLFIGGTGPSPRDITVDVIEDTAWRCLPGFGELFRYLSYQKIGYIALLSRPSLCILHDGKITAALPGSIEAVELGLNILSKIIHHVVEEVDRFEGPHRPPRRE